jgi:signal transduction histidine kinase
LALATFLQLLRPSSIAERRAQRAYRAEVQQVASRMQTIFEDWLSLREIESNYSELANAAAVWRWELMRLARSAELLEPPRSWVGIHRDVHNAVLGSARACQLLANGYRGHKTDAVCDGQALLLDTLADINALVDQLQMRA